MAKLKAKLRALLIVVFLGLSSFGCTTMQVTEPTSYCKLSSFIPMTPEAIVWVSQHDAALGQGIRKHNATWLRECKK